MTAYDEERLGELLRLLRPAPEGWARAAQELPRARRSLDRIVAQAEADAVPAGRARRPRGRAPRGRDRSGRAAARRAAPPPACRLDLASARGRARAGRSSC